MTNPATQSFDRMRSMLLRAAEIRDSEQQQIFDALDEIHARLAPLESLGSVRKRLAEIPDRTEASVLAERLDEALARLETQDGAIAGLHKRLDDLEHHLDRHDTRLDALPAGVHEPVREQIGAAESGLRTRLDVLDKDMRESLSSALESITQRLDALSGGLGTLEGALAHRPDVDSLSGLVRQANEESELRYTAQLDEAMATFVEIIMGGGVPAALPALPPPPPPRPAQRRVRARQTKPVEAEQSGGEGGVLADAAS